MTDEDVRPWSLANFQAVFGNLTGEVARPTLWRGRPRPRSGGTRPPEFRQYQTKDYVRLDNEGVAMYLYSV